jgi:hypothetical protein
MWLLVGSCGVITTILLLLYDRFIAPRTSAVTLVDQR